MNEKVKQAIENFKCIKEDLDYFQPKDLVCTNREEQYKSVENALNDFDKYYESQQDLIKGKDEYIAKLCNDRAELKEQNKILKEELDVVNDFRKHYKFYLDKLANNLKTINCMQEEATTNYNLIEQLEDRNDRLVERLEKQKAELKTYKNIEKELGIDLDIFFKIIKKGIWSKELLELKNKDCRQCYPFRDLELRYNKTGILLCFNHKSYKDCTYVFSNSVFLKDYDKTYSIVKSHLAKKVVEKYGER